MIGVEATAAPSRLRREARAAGAAVCFLTRLPFGRRLPVGADDLARAGVAFPVVGVCVGALQAAVALLLLHPLGASLAALLAVAAGALATGALHLDALADSADALGARSRERALAVMRDHAIGSYGAVALVLDLLLKAGALAALAAHGQVLRAAVAAGALSRAAPVLLATWLPYARREDGLGAPLTRGGRGRALVAAVLAAAIAAAVVTGWQGAGVAAVAAALVLLLGLGLRRWLGGVTGDTLGAAAELSELAALLTAIGLLGAR